MIDSILLLTVFSVIVLPMVISLFYFIKITFKYTSFYIDQLILSNILFLLWTIAVIPVNIFTQMFDANTTILLEQLGTICGALGIIFLIEALLNPIRGTMYLLIPHTSIITFAIIIGMKFLEIFQNKPSENIYGLRLNSDGSFTRITNIFVLVIIAIAFISFLITIIYFTYLHNSMPSWIIPQNTKNRANIAVIFIILGVITNIFGLLLPSPLSQISLVLSRITTTYGFIFLSLQYFNNPLISLSEHGNPIEYLQRGLIGWSLSSILDNGPEILHFSDSFAKYYNLSERDITFFAIITTTITGAGRNFNEKVFITPFPLKNKQLTAISYAFTHNDPRLKDPRKENKANAVFSILLPNQFMPSFGNINKTSFFIRKYIENTSTITELAQNSPFFDITLKTLRNLTLHRII